MHQRFTLHRRPKQANFEVLLAQAPRQFANRTHADEFFQEGWRLFAHLKRAP
jgi:hypothetical protein